MEREPPAKEEGWFTSLLTLDDDDGGGGGGDDDDDDDNDDNDDDDACRGGQEIEREPQAQEEGWFISLLTLDVLCSPSGTFTHTISWSTTLVKS